MSWYVLIFSQLDIKNIGKRDWKKYWSSKWSRCFFLFFLQEFHLVEKLIYFLIVHDIILHMVMVTVILPSRTRSWMENGNGRLIVVLWPNMKYDPGTCPTWHNHSQLQVLCSEEVWCSCLESEHVHHLYVVLRLMLLHRPVMWLRLQGKKRTLFHILETQAWGGSFPTENLSHGTEEHGLWILSWK